MTWGVDSPGPCSTTASGPETSWRSSCPNWVEAVACFYGLFPLGVVVVPIVHIYGAEGGRSTSCGRAEPGVLITADRFGRQDYVANLEEMAAEPCPTSRW